MRRGFPGTLDIEHGLLQRRARSGRAALDGSENRKLRHYRGGRQGWRKRRRKVSDPERHVRIDRMTENQNPRRTDGSRDDVRCRRRRNVRNDRYEFSAHRCRRRRMTGRNDVLFVRRRDLKHFRLRRQMIHGRIGRNLRLRRQSSVFRIRLRRRRHYRRIRQHHVRLTGVRYDGMRRVLFRECRIRRRRRCQIRLHDHLYALRRLRYVHLQHDLSQIRRRRRRMILGRRGVVRDRFQFSCRRRRGVVQLWKRPANVPLNGGKLWSLICDRRSPITKRKPPTG